MAANKTVLLVDDDPIVKECLFDMLRRARFEIIEARTGEEALRLAQRQPLDLVLVDVGLPGIDGFEVTEQLRALPGSENTPIVYITGHERSTVEGRGAMAGGDFYVLKPFDPADVAVDVHTLLAALDDPASVTELHFRVMRRVPLERAGEEIAPSPKATPPADAKDELRNVVGELRDALRAMQRATQSLQRLVDGGER